MKFCFFPHYLDLPAVGMCVFGHIQVNPLLHREFQLVIGQIGANNDFGEGTHLVMELGYCVATFKCKTK